MWLFGKKDTLSDEQLLADYFKSGNSKALGILFNRHAKSVFGVCLFYFKDKSTAEDMTMQVFEKLHTELRKTIVKNFKGWLSFVVRNHCISQLRKNKNKQFVGEGYLDFEMREATWEEEEKILSVSDEEMLQHLQEALHELKSKQRICVELFYLNELSYQQISSQTGYGINEVKSYIQNGRRNLKLAIEEKMKNKKHAA